MFKVLIWDYTGESAKWCETNLDKNAIEVIHTITPQELVPEILLKKDAWDWLLIFERNMRIAFNTTIKVLKLPLEKIIYALDSNNWARFPKAVHALINYSEGGGNKIRRWQAYTSHGLFNDFMVCTVEGLSYISVSNDMITRTMYASQRNWAVGSIKRFQDLSKQYYNVDDSSGYFLDLGANIGTTGIYFLKKIAPNLKLLAFEPSSETFKMHRINIILNDLEESATLVNCGLGNETSELTLHHMPGNPGANSINIVLNKNLTSETIKVITLDSYLAENKIAASEVKYIWIDTEGFEAQVLLGAKNLLKENPLPIFMECNLKAWDESGCFDDMMTLLAENYSHFIHFHHGEKIYPLETLRTIERPSNALGQCGNIFFIKKGAIA